MGKDALPKKILLIRDCTFILPDDFSGSIEDAFDEFLKYRSANLQHAHYVDDGNLFSTFDVLLHSNKDPKVCGQYAIYELDDGKYRLADTPHRE